MEEPGGKADRLAMARVGEGGGRGESEEGGESREKFAHQFPFGTHRP